MSAREKTTGFIAEFRKFIARGNVLDLAVGVIIGGAFSKITTSLVEDIINPVLGIFTGGGEALSALALSLPGGGALMLGNFINAVLNFLIMAFVVFCIVKLFNAAHERAEAALRRQQAEQEAAQAAAPPPPSAEEVLLTEIRDLLREHQENGHA